MNGKAFRKKAPLIQRGLTLIEAAMVLSIATLVVAGIMMFFQSANMNARTNEAVGQLGAVQQAVRSVYAGQPTYAGLNAQALADTRSLPTKMVVGTGAAATLRHAFNGTITVEPVTITGGSANNGFSIEFDGVPSEACSKFATMDLGTGLFSMDRSAERRVGRECES